MKLPAWITRNRWRGITTRILPFQKRKRLVHWGHWGIAHTSQIGYTETPQRAAWLSHKPPNKLPLATDCSGFVTLCYRMAGVPDPSRLGYQQLGHTRTLPAHAGGARLAATSPPRLGTEACGGQTPPRPCRHAAGIRLSTIPAYQLDPNGRQ